MPNTILFLVGPMGAGKTTIGKLLAKKINWEFCDLDAEIEARCGADIAWIFDVEGEEGFRNRETQILDELSRKEKLVMATGGGSILREENRRILGSRGMVVYLQTPLEKLIARTRKDKKRPLLQVEDRDLVLKKLLDQRDPLYREVADLIIASDFPNPQMVVDEIIASIGPQL